tara:strand:+ start:69 stop:2039 length:1971 start_codon:yes stop_codon:yes gene_type:complete
MDRYDDLLIKAREEMMGKQPLRKGRDSKQLFSQVWEQVMKAPQYSQEFVDQYNAAQQAQQQRQAQERQQANMSRTMAPQPADPFGQMNEGASLESAGQQQPTGMGANFSQGRSETRDPNKTGMFGRAKQGISNFMGRFRRQPAEQETAQGTVESASGSPPTMEAREPKSKGIGVRESYIRTHGKEPADEWLRMYAPDELTARQEEQSITSTPPSIANKYRDVDPDSASSRLAEMREEMGGRAAPTTPSSMQSIYDRINNDMKPIEPQQTTPEKTATRAGLDEMQTRLTDYPQRRDLDAELREFGIDNRGQMIEPPQEMEETESMTEREREIEALAGSGKQDQLREMLEAEKTDKPSVDEMTTTRTGTRMPKGALPMKRRPESRMLTEKVESREPQPMGGIQRRKPFDEVNNRSQEQKDAQHPEARYKDNRLKQKDRREKIREKYSYERPPEDEPKPPKKAAPKKAAPKKAAPKKAKTEKPIEGTQEMREEAPPKKKTGSTKAQRGKKPVNEDIEGAQVMQEPAKPKNASAKKLVETTAKNRKEKGQGVKPFPKPTQKARQRNKNPKKKTVNEGNEAAAKARSEKRQQAKKKEAVSEPEDKTYTRYISGSTDKDYVNEVVEAARNGNASAISRLRNDKADLVDHHGFSDDEIDEITG